MKIEVLKENFQKALNITERAIGKIINLPFLEDVLIETEENYIKLTSTNLEIGITTRVLGKTIKKGKVLVPIKILSSFIGFLPIRELSLFLKDNNLVIKSHNFISKVPTHNVEDFPVIPKIQENRCVKIKNKTLSEGLSQVVDFTSITNIKPELSGVYFSLKEGVLKLVATDSFRLTEKTIKLENLSDIEFSFILPVKTVRELINILKEGDGYVEIYPSSNLILFKILFDSIVFNIEVVSKTIEGEYPDYQEVIPKSFKTKLILKRDEFLNTLKAISLFSGRTNEVRFKVDPDTKKMLISAQSPEKGEARSLISVDGEGNRQEISFNYKFLIDGLLNIKDPEIEFSLINEESPGVLKPINDQSYIYILMPIKSY